MTEDDILTQDAIDALDPTAFKVYENRCRRGAERQRLRFEKSRRRDRRAPDFGGYWLIDTDGVIVAGGENGTNLFSIAAYLWGDRG